MANRTANKPNRACMLVKNYGTSVRGKVKGGVVFQLNSIGAAMLTDGVRYGLRFTEDALVLEPADVGSVVTYGPAPRLNIKNFKVGALLMERTKGRPVHMFPVLDGDKMVFPFADMTIR